YICCFFFFSSRRRHTRSYGDWSSDVCSSDLYAAPAGDQGRAARGRSLRAQGPAAGVLGVLPHRRKQRPRRRAGLRNESWIDRNEIGRASCRERVEIRGREVEVKNEKEERERG